MKVNCLVGTLLVLCLGATLHSWAEPTKSQRELFETTKAQADKGDAEAQLRLGLFYANGIGVTKDLRKAAKWHRKAADQGLARAEYQLGQDYAMGDGVKPDDIQAAKWFKMAADQQLPEAELELGFGYLDGHGVPVNSGEAVRCFRRAADHGLPHAEYELGVCYLEGTGVSTDIIEGLRHVKLAAEEGDAAAQNRLGLAYQKGEGVPKDLVQAYKWFSLAAAQDDDNAKDIRVNVAKAETFLSKEQVAEAQRLARDFKPVQPRPAAATSGSGTTNSVSAVPSPAGSAEIGFVNVKAEDDRSEVYADGAFVGNPPARLKLNPGAHLIEVKQAGFKAYTRTITISAGSDLTLRAVLEKQ